MDDKYYDFAASIVTVISTERFYNLCEFTNIECFMRNIMSFA